MDIRLRGRWITLIILSIALFCVVYWLAVLTPTGQEIENAALTGAKLSGTAQIQDARDQLDMISKGSLIVGIIIVGIIGYIHSGFRLAASGVCVIAGGVILAEVLKRFVLPRPDLVGAPADIAHNSFPSGHTTIAMTFLVGILIVTPYRWRGLAMLLTMAWATTIGAATLAAQWHRLSDTIGGAAIAVIAGAIASIYLANSGMIKAAPPKTYPLRVAYVSVTTVLGISALAVGLTLGYLTQQRVIAGTTDYNIDLYEAAHAISFGACLLAALVFWGTWRRLEVPKRAQSLQ